MAPGAPSCVEAIHIEFPTDPQAEGQRRAALAEWLADAKNPLTHRSIVNRVWEYHFGRGIVATPSDFGRNGIAPTHPELLDFLADEFAKNGESIKKLHRAHRHQRDLPAILGDERKSRRDRRGQSPPLAHEPHTARSRAGARRGARGERQARSQDGRPWLRIVPFHRRQIAGLRSPRRRRD
ncbi:MAG: DUF1553 domain-containing protein [Chthoniobacter sp.]